jgi:hypothetical protein
MYKITMTIKGYSFIFSKFEIHFKFGSWTYDESAINLQNKSSEGQVDSYIKNGEWFLKGKLILEI